MCNYLYLRLQPATKGIIDLSKIEKKIKEMQGVLEINMNCVGRYDLMIESDGVDPEQLKQQLLKEIPEIVEVRILRGR